jgi:hypothetical protein
VTKELAEKKCYELINRALRIAREYDPDVNHISCFIVEGRPEGSRYTDVRAIKNCEGFDDDGFPNTEVVLDFNKSEYVTTIGKGEQA